MCKICLMPSWIVFAECQTAYAGWGKDTRLDNWRYNQHNVFWKGKRKLCHMFTQALILCKTGCSSFDIAKVSFRLQFRVCFIYLTRPHMPTCTMHSSDPSWRIWIRSGHVFPSLECRAKITCIFSRTAIDAASSSECCWCLLHLRQLNVITVSTTALPRA